MITASPNNAANVSSGLVQKQTSVPLGGPCWPRACVCANKAYVLSVCVCKCVNGCVFVQIEDFGAKLKSLCTTC